MLKNIIFGFELSSALLILKFIPFVFYKKRWKIFIKNLDIKNIALEWFFGAITISVFFQFLYILKIELI